MKNATWTLAGGRALGPAPFFIAGVVNVTPDSFHDGGRHFSTEAAVAHGRRLAEEGAHILDVGGESTRPGADPVSLEEELRRVVPVVRELAGQASASPQGPVVSVDTYKAAVAEAALDAGAAMVNDVSACRFDPALLDVVAGRRPGYVLMHSQGEPRRMQLDPRYDDVVDDLLAFFEERLAVLVRAGLPEENVFLDPGIGFGKTLEHNLEILRRIEEFERLGRPLYLGMSNKSLWARLLDLGDAPRVSATQAGTALMAARGVVAHRVHDVALTRQTLAVVLALERRAG